MGALEALVYFMGLEDPVLVMLPLFTYLPMPSRIPPVVPGLYFLADGEKSLPMFEFHLRPDPLHCVGRWVTLVCDGDGY